MSEHLFVATRGAASILHADLDAFYASVEQRDDPSLRGRPVLVGGGVVLAASYEAKARGVKTAMGGRQALRLCPDAVVVDARFAAYTEASRAVFAIFEDTTPLVQGLSIDEAFLDVGGLGRIAGPPPEIAARLRTRVLAEVGLPISVGVARTKFLAKVASGVAKPDGLLVVEPDREREFLHPLPVGRLWGVGPITSEKLGDRGIRTVRDLASVGEAGLVAIVGGATGRHLHALAHGRDPRPVERGTRRGSIGSQSAFGRRPQTAEDLDARLVGLVDRVTRRLRKAERVGRTITLRLRFGDYSRATRSRSLPHATDRTDEVLATVRALMEKARPLIEEKGITLVGVAVGGLTDNPPVQMALPFGKADATALDTAVDRVRASFGNGAVQRTVLLGRRQVEVPLLPD